VYCEKWLFSIAILKNQRVYSVVNPIRSHPE
jgi:hypothetical protein